MHLVHEIPGKFSVCCLEVLRMVFVARPTPPYLRCRGQFFLLGVGRGTKVDEMYVN